MERKQKDGPVDHIEPMPRKQFLNLMREFKKRGGAYLANKESEEFLISKNVEACTLNATMILFRRRPTRAAVYEELYHVEQFREGKIDGTIINAYENEIEAQRYLLSNIKEFELTEAEVKRTQKALEWYTEKLSELKGDEHYDGI